MIDFHVPARAEFRVRQQWLSDPAFMAYNAGWDVSHPGYDRETGCIAWPESEWDVFAERLALGADRQGYYYLRDRERGLYVGHAHYTVEPDAVAHIGLNIRPPERGRGLGTQVLHMLVERVWRQTTVQEIVNEFEDGRVAAARTHRRCGFVPDREAGDRAGRPTRTWRLVSPFCSEVRPAGRYPR